MSPLVERLACGGYPASAVAAGKQRLIVDYVIDGNRHAIVGYFVRLP